MSQAFAPDRFEAVAWVYSPSDLAIMLFFLAIGFPGAPPPPRQIPTFIPGEGAPRRVPGQSAPGQGKRAATT